MSLSSSSLDSGVGHASAIWARVSGTSPIQASSPSERADCNAWESWSRRGASLPSGGGVSVGSWVVESAGVAAGAAAGFAVGVSVVIGVAVCVCVCVFVAAAIAAGVTVGSGVGVGSVQAARSVSTMSVASTMRFFSNGVSLIQGIPASIVPTPLPVSLHPSVTDNAAGSR